MSLNEKYRGKYWIGVVILVEKEGEVLLLKAPQNSWAPGQYLLPGGSKEPGESLTEAAVRELKEELGIHVLEEDLEHIHTASLVWSGAVNFGEGLSLFFRLEKWQGTPQNCEPHKCEGLFWMPRTEAYETMVPVNQRVLRLSDQGVRTSHHDLAHLRVKVFGPCA